MTFLNKIVNFEYESEYANEYYLTLKPKFSTPKIQSYKGNLNKRWYLYYSYRNPETGKMKRLSPIYGSANKFKTKEDRMTILTGHRRILLRLLMQGFNPFIDNTVLYNSLYNTQPKPIATVSLKEVAIAPVVEKVTGMEYTKALEFVLNQKIKQISDSGKSTFVSRIKDFELWIKETHPELKSINLVNRKIILAYLNHILDRTSARTRNNYKADLSSVFQVLEDNEIISKNVVKGIPSLKQSLLEIKRIR